MSGPGTRAAPPPAVPGRRAFPVLRARSVAETVSFYERLGFTCRVRHPSTGEPVFVALIRDRAELAVTAAEPEDQPAADRGAFEMFVLVDDVDASVECLRTVGVPVLSEPVDMPWGERVAAVADPDSVRVALASPRAS
ncbi:VOC family protein [Streptomyces sp. TE33382]